MKTKTALHSILSGLLVTSFFAGEVASAQLKTTVQSKTKTLNRISTKVAPIAPAKSKFSFNMVNIAFMMDKNESNYVETDVTLSYQALEKVSLNLDTGLESYFYSTEKNNTYDVEPSVMVSDIELLPDFNLEAGLFGVIATSREAHEIGKTGGFGPKLNLSLKVEPVSIALENTFYQFIYSSPPGPTPFQDDLKEDNTYKNAYSVQINALSVTAPIVAGLKWKNDLRNKVWTYFNEEATRKVRYRSRLGYSFNDNITAQFGVSYQKDMSKKDVAFFAKDNRLFFFLLSLSI